MSANKAPKHNLGVLRSFGRRKGRVLPAYKQKLVDELLPKLAPKTNLSENKEYWLEIGFGAGEHMFELAKAYPNKQIIGAEPYLNGVAKLLTHIDEYKIDNIRIINDDVRPWLTNISNSSLTGVYILFPDPWPKRKQHKKRIINKQLLDLIACKLKPNGILRIATDHVDYSAWIMEHSMNNANFTWQAKYCDDWQTPYDDWKETRYQQKTTKQGRLPVFLEFQKN